MGLFANYTSRDEWTRVAGPWRGGRDESATSIKRREKKWRQERGILSEMDLYRVNIVDEVSKIISE